MATPIQSGESAGGVYLTGKTLTAVNNAVKKLKPKGITRSQLLAESIAEGLPAVVKRLSKRKDRVSLLECVEALVRRMPGDITRARVIEALEKDYASTVKQYDANTLSANVASYLRRLKDRDVLEEHGQTKEKGAKGFREYSVNVYRLKSEDGSKK